MGECRYCGKKGFLLRVSRDGLCPNCTPFVVLDVNQRARIIEESLSLIEKSKKTATRLSRCDLVTGHAEALLEYEQRGITTIDPLPSIILQSVAEQRREIVVEHARTEVDKWLAKAEVAATTTTTLTNAGKALLAIDQARTDLNDGSLMTDTESAVREYMFDAKLNDFLDAARKAHFKGNAKKAVDRYQEALYLIKTEGQYFSEPRVEQAREIEAKLAELRVG